MWQTLKISSDGTHHTTEGGVAAYSERFDHVLKFHCPGLAPVSKAGCAWHIKPDGLPAYEQRFLQAFGFYEDLAAVSGDDGWFHVTISGKPAYDQRYAWCGNFQDGRCTVRDTQGMYHHIKVDGSAAYESLWRYAGDYRDGIAVVQASDGRSTHIDRDGQLVHACWFVDLDVFHKGFARARDDEGWMHVDSHGRSIYGRRFSSIEPFYNGQARVERFDGAIEVIDETGATLVELRPPRRSEFATLSGDMVGFWRTQTIAAAVRLRVVEALPASEGEVAEQCALRLDGARRILKALGELGLAVKDSGRWKLTLRGSFLRVDHPMTLADAALEYAGPFSDMWHRLAEALSCSTTWTAPDIFGEIARDKDRAFKHHRMLQSYARHDYVAVDNALGLQGGERIIDAGGGLGVLGGIILDAYPSVQLTILERPEVVSLAQATCPRQGLRWHGGDILEPWCLDADVVLLSRVLHDWDDAAALQILKHARKALTAGGRLCIIEMLLPEDGTAGALCDLHLLMVTGGRERSLVEFRRLLESAGFKLQGVRTLPALPSVIVGVAS